MAIRWNKRPEASVGKPYCLFECFIRSSRPALFQVSPVYGVTRAKRTQSRISATQYLSPRPVASETKLREPFFVRRSLARLPLREIEEYSLCDLPWLVPFCKLERDSAIDVAGILKPSSTSLPWTVKLLRHLLLSYCIKNIVLRRGLVSYFKNHKIFDDCFRSCIISLGGFHTSHLLNLHCFADEYSQSKYVLFLRKYTNCASCFFQRAKTRFSFLFVRISSTK